jgi:hypothetical protein
MSEGFALQCFHYQLVSQSPDVSSAIVSLAKTMGESVLLAVTI